LGKRGFSFNVLLLNNCSRTHMSASQKPTAPLILSWLPANLLKGFGSF
jgi:hypothetical protein